MSSTIRLIAKHASRAERALALSLRIVVSRVAAPFPAAPTVSTRVSGILWMVDMAVARIPGHAVCNAARLVGECAPSAELGISGCRMELSHRADCGHLNQGRADALGLSLDLSLFAVAQIDRAANNIRVRTLLDLLDDLVTHILEDRLARRVVQAQDADDRLGEGAVGWCQPFHMVLRAQCSKLNH